MKIAELRGREMGIVNQTNIGAVSRSTLGRLLKDGMERIWASQMQRCHLELNWTARFGLAFSCLSVVYCVPCLVLVFVVKALIFADTKSIKGSRQPTKESLKRASNLNSTRTKSKNSETLYWIV